MLVAWAILFGLSITTLRLVILAAFGAAPLTAHQITGLVLSIPGEITTGLLLALPLYLLRRTRWRWTIYPVLIAVVSLSAAAFHYEAVFSRLPGLSVLYYLREARHLASSAGKHAPMGTVAVEIAVVSALLIAAAESLGNRKLRPLAAAVCIVSAVFTLVVFVWPRLVPRQFERTARTPILWAIRGWSIERVYETGPLRLDRQQVLAYQRALGHLDPSGGLDERYPLCDPTPRAAASPNGRSVILLILESVAVEEARRMPTMQRIAADSVVFPDTKAGGTKSLQAMPALLAGVPPQPAAHLLWRTPLNNLAGFPLTLREQGYKTAYFHGGDLSFEQQRPFLRMMGFEEIIELDPTERLPLYGWGYSDDVMFRKMERWIDAHRGTPYLATLFTLSTHDPYVIPNGAPAASQPLQTAFEESLRFLDEQLRQFYDWFLRNEAPRGTVLVITGDHAPHLAAGRHIEDDEVTRFTVPLLVRGPQPGVSSRPAAHHDIPATIIGLTGLPQGPCDQGMDLFGPSMLGNRVRYAVSGDELEEFQVWFPDASVHLDRVRGEARAKPTRGGRAAATDAARRAEELYKLARSVSAYLVKADAFAPPPATVRLARKQLERVTRPMFVSHRGQSRGALPPEQQNKRAAIEQAIRDGFSWIEIDVNVTRDGVPVVVHDDVATTSLAELRAMPGMSDVLTLDEAIGLFGKRVGLLVELKPQKTLAGNSMLALRSAVIVREKGAPGRIIIDSFSPFLASSAEKHCRCPVGIDAPNRPLDSRWVDSVALEGLEWIYADHRQASSEVIRHAHSRGLRVLVYTVNDLAEIDRLEPEWPDAVITDRAQLVAAFDAKR